MERAVSQAPTGSADWSKLKDQMAIWWAWCCTALSPSLLLQQGVDRPTMTVSHPLTPEGHQSKVRDFIRLNTLYMQTHSWPKQSRLEQRLSEKHLQFKSLSLAFAQCNEAHIGWSCSACELLSEQFQALLYTKSNSTTWPMNCRVSYCLRIWLLIQFHLWTADKAKSINLCSQCCVRGDHLGADTCCMLWTGVMIW